MDNAPDPKEVLKEFFRAAQAFVARREAARAARIAAGEPEPAPKPRRKRRNDPEYTAFFSNPDTANQAPSLGPNQMTARSFLDWMDAAGCQSVAAVVRKLGCRRRLAEGWVKAAQAGDVLTMDRVYRLALAATVEGLQAWPQRAASGTARHETSIGGTMMSEKKSRPFTILIHKEEGTSYGLTFPDLPGCIAAADDRDDIERAATEALDLWFEDMPDTEPASFDEVSARHEVAEQVRGGAILLAMPYIREADRS